MNETAHRLNPIQYQQTPFALAKYIITDIKPHFSGIGYRGVGSALLDHSSSQNPGSELLVFD